MELKNILGRLPNTAFLCGANRPDSMRIQFINYVKSYHKPIFISGEQTENILSDDRIIIAEQAEKLWERSLKEANTGYNNLLEFELDIAELASVIPVFLEERSWGAMVEAGAFFSSPRLKEKLLVIVQKHKFDNSFIDKAIIKELSSNERVIFYENNINQVEREKFFKKVFEKIFKFREERYEINIQQDNLTSLYFFLIKILCSWKTKEEIIEELNKKDEFKRYTEKINNHLKVLESFGMIIKEEDFDQVKFLSLIRNDISKNSSILEQVGVQTESESSSNLILLKYMKKISEMDWFSYKYQKEITQCLYKKPEKQLQVLQKILRTRIFNNKEIFPVHELATAYKKGVNIKANAEKHLRNQYILRLDFKNFFDSIKRSDFLDYLKSRELYSEYRDFICDVAFKNDSIDNEIFSLPTGASTSPIISNILLYCFDEHISKYCHSLGVTYTRYADDLTFSHSEKNKLQNIKIHIKEILQKIPYPLNLQINHKKTFHMSKRGKRKITGLYLTPEGKISIGRKKKTYIKKLLRDYVKEEDKTKLYQSCLKIQDSIEGKNLKNSNKISISYIQGHLLFIKSVEKDFWDRLYNKYGKDFRDLFYPQQLISRPR